MKITKDIAVTLDFVMKDEDGNIIDSSEINGPLQYIHGYENIVPGMEEALYGKGEGDKVSCFIIADNGYGEYDQSLKLDIDREFFKGLDKLEIGMVLQLEDEDGVHPVTIVSFNDKKVTVDGNHPLAGVNFIFEAEVKRVRSASIHEKASGLVVESVYPKKKNKPKKEYGGTKNFYKKRDKKDNKK